VLKLNRSLKGHKITTVEITVSLLSILILFRLFVKCCGNSFGMVQTPGAFFSSRPLHFSIHRRYALAS